MAHYRQLSELKTAVKIEVLEVLHDHVEPRNLLSKKHLAKNDRVNPPTQSRQHDCL